MTKTVSVLPRIRIHTQFGSYFSQNLPTFSKEYTEILSAVPFEPVSDTIDGETKIIFPYARTIKFNCPFLVEFVDSNNLLLVELETNIDEEREE